MTDHILTPELVEKLTSCDTPTVSNAVETFKVRSRREGYMGPQIQCRFPDLGEVAGYAVTCTIVDEEDGFEADPAERAAWSKAIEECPGPVICVVQDLCHRKGWSSHWGEMVGTHVNVLGCVGIITDGAVRDLDALHDMGMKVWSEHVVVSHGQITVGKANVPVEVGGLTVNPGDILVADKNGIVSVPPGILNDIPKVIDDILAGEAKGVKQMRGQTAEDESKRKVLKH
jgi:4-hydroxy-4-methyl-2-oxoglutarate aldolase